MMDAMVENISITPELTTNQQKYLSYEVTYLDGVAVEEKDILHANKARTLKIRVEYKKNIENNDLVSNDEIINIKATIKYVQADATAKESLSSEGNIIFKLTKITGDGTQVGDELAIGDEHFYVISNDGENITMLAKHNLLVGNQCPSACTPISNPTGIQDVSAKAFPGGTDRLGSIQFSSTPYWSGVASRTYVYDNRASISNYVYNYKNYLESFGAEITDARLITLDEVYNLGCIPNAGTGACSSAPTWVYSSTYWTGTSYDNNKLYCVVSRNQIDNASYNLNNFAGVRPVIVISTDAL